MDEEIVQKENAVLRKIARPLRIEEIQTEEIQNLIEKMKKVLKKEDDGVALAAPQVGESIQLFIVAGKIFQTTENPTVEDLVFINPKIVSTSPEEEWMEEGCLSVRGIYGKVLRSVSVTLESTTKTGALIKTEASGLLAHIFQHEVDHLNGVLFLDKAKDLMGPQTKND